MAGAEILIPLFLYSGLESKKMCLGDFKGNQGPGERLAEYELGDTYGDDGRRLHERVLETRTKPV